jgi:hypothetical protein
MRPLPAIFAVRLIRGRWFVYAAGQQPFPYVHLMGRRRYATSRSRSRRRTTATGLRETLKDFPPDFPLQACPIDMLPPIGTDAGEVLVAFAILWMLHQVGS